MLRSRELRARGPQSPFTGAPRLVGAAPLEPEEVETWEQAMDLAREDVSKVMSWMSELHRSHCLTMFLYLEYAKVLNRLV